MSEHDVLAHLRALEDAEPVTLNSLMDDLHDLGLKPGMCVLVHTSLSRLGWVLGGPQTVVAALLEVLGSGGTLMMPTHSMQLTDPRHWRNPPVPEPWWPIIRAHAPVYDTALTPTRDMGCVAELFRSQPGVVRSSHPHGSFAARGPLAATLTEAHALEQMFGEASPLGRLYQADGYVLLLGVDHANNTSLHLAEHRADFPARDQLIQGARLSGEDGPQWTTFRHLDYDAGDFGAAGAAFTEADAGEIRGAIGWGEGRLMSQRAVVDFGQRWLQRHRSR